MAAFSYANGPLSIAMDATILQTYSSGIIDPTAAQCTTNLDHAIVIVVNNRGDRVARSEVFARIMVQDLSADAFVLIGTNLTGLHGYVKTALDAHVSELHVQPAGTTVEQAEAKLRAKDFLAMRLPKFLGYFERALARNGGTYFVGGAASYVDLSVFQIMVGLAYAFPRAMAAAEAQHPLLVALRDRVAARPNIAAYLASPRRLAFNENGIFRRYPELDLAE